jgi:Arylsulfotransferase (ASST)
MSKGTGYLVKERLRILGAAVVLMVLALPTGAAQAEEITSPAGAELALDRTVHRPALARALAQGPDLLAFGPLITPDGRNRELVLGSDLRLRKQEALAVGVLGASPLSRGRIAYIDNACNYTGYSTCSDIWIQKGATRTPLGLGRLGLDFHEVLRDRDGDFWALAYEPRLCWEKEEWNALCGPGTTAKTIFRDCTVLEFTPTGEVTYRWNASDHLPPSELRLAEHGHAFNGDTRDPFHCNSIELMGTDQSAFLVSARHTDAVYAVKTSTGGVAWKLGGNDWPGHSMAVSGTSENASTILDSQHDARLWGPNTLSVFDNGSVTGRAARGLVFDIRPGARTAALRAEYEEPSGESSGCTGSFRPVEVRNDRYWLAGWGCAAAGATVFTDNGKPIVSTRLRQDAAARSVTNPNLTSNRYSLSYRVIPLVR